MTPAQRKEDFLKQVERLFGKPLELKPEVKEQPQPEPVTREIRLPYRDD